MSDEHSGRNADQLLLEILEQAVDLGSDALDQLLEAYPTAVADRARRLISDGVTHDFLAAPLALADHAVETGPFPTTTRVGPYEMLGLLGEGGMGRVYLAEQHEPVRRRVALKVLRTSMLSRGEAVRFEAERQAMARLDHVNVGKILEAGTTREGLPFLAMEWIAGMKAEPTHTATEYCTMLELRNFFGTAAQKTGEVAHADRAEKLTFNGMLGARNQDGTAITYGKPDNCYKLDGKSLDGEEKEVRYKYSPTHSEPAVCCAPNYTRNLTYYLDQMWGRDESGFAALLYGPCKMTTNLSGIDLSIEQKTEYPYSDKIVFEISTSEPIEFTLSLRKPQWAGKLILDEEQFSVEGDFYRINKQWNNGDLLSVEFEYEVEAKRLDNGEVYFQRGPLVYALEIPHRRENIKRYEVEGFHDYYCHAMNDEFRDLEWGGADMSINDDVEKGLHLTGSLVDKETKEEKAVELIPMGETVLRRVTFPVR